MMFWAVAVSKFAAIFTTKTPVLHRIFAVRRIAAGRGVACHPAEKATRIRRTKPFARFFGHMGALCEVWPNYHQIESDAARQREIHAIIAYIGCRYRGSEQKVVQKADEPDRPEPVVIDPAEPKWGDLLEIDARMHQQKNIRLLTPEARVLFALTIGGPMQINSAMQIAGTSYRGFYAVLERLKQAGLVQIHKDTEDQRVRKLSVEPAPSNAGK